MVRLFEDGNNGGYAVRENVIVQLGCRGANFCVSTKTRTVNPTIFFIFAVSNVRGLTAGSRAGDET